MFNHEVAMGNRHQFTIKAIPLQLMIWRHKEPYHVINLCIFDLLNNNDYAFLVLG